MEGRDAEAAGQHEQEHERVRRRDGGETHADCRQRGPAGDQPERLVAVGPQPEERLDDRRRERRREEQHRRERVAQVELVREVRDQRRHAPGREVDREVAARQRCHRAPVDRRPHVTMLTIRLLRPGRGGASVPSAPAVDLDLAPEHELIRDDRARVRARPHRTRRRGARPRGPVPVRARRRARRARADGDPRPRGVRRRRRQTSLSYAIAIEELTRVDSSVAITVAAHTSLGTMPILLFGSEEQKREWLPELAAGRRLAAFGLTEPDAGSDAGATRTTAELRDGAVGGQRLEDLHHQRRHRHDRVRDDHRAHRPGRDLEPDRARTARPATRSRGR